MMKTILLSFGLLISSFVYASESLPEKVWISVSPTKELYAEYYAPAPGKPTLVLLHGLTYTTHQWSKFIKEATAKGFGIVCYDMEGMGQTLLKYAPIMSIIPMTNQVVDLKVLLEKLEVKKPYNILGLSYGGGVAFAFAVKYPELTGNLILLSPYTKPVKKIDDMIKSQVTAARLANPMNPFTDDQVYEFYFRQFVYATYPVSEPIVLENPYKLESVFRLSQGVGAFIPEDHTSEIKVPTHLMIAEKDQYFPKEEFTHFWSLFPEKYKKNFFVVKNSEHKIPEAEPAQAFEMIQTIFK